MEIKIVPIFRKDKINQDHTAPIHFRFTQNRKIRYVSTSITVHEDDWDTEKLCLKTNKEKQYQIDTKLLAYKKKIQRLEALEIEVTLDTLLERKLSRGHYTLTEAFQQTIVRLEALGKYGSVSKHKAALSLLMQFHPVTIRLDEISLAFLCDFELFLHKRGNNDNSIATKMSLLKAVYNRALAEETFTPKSNPFIKFKVGRLWTPTRKRAISKEQIQNLITLEPPRNHPSPYFIFARDIFLFIYYTAGINFGDVATLRYQDIRQNRVYFTRHKTGKEITCLLMPYARQIVEKYSRPNHSEADYIFPILNREVHVSAKQQFNRIHKVLQHVNTHLKEWGRMAGLDIPLTTYVARHTFATVLKRSGVNIAIISESLGHSDLSTTQIYLDSFENSQIDEAMKHLL